jgi:hypothetical protein
MPIEALIPTSFVTVPDWDDAFELALDCESAVTVVVWAKALALQNISDISNRRFMSLLLGENPSAYFLLSVCLAPFGHGGLFLQPR